MDMDFGIYSLYSNLIDTKVKFCSLCFKIVTQNAACVQDSVILGDAECSDNEEVDMQYILHEILGDKTTSYLSGTDAICNDCTHQAISSYKFIKMCQMNMERMATAVDLFSTKINDPDANFNDKKSLFLCMNFQDSTCIQYFDTIKFENNKSALTRFQTLFRSYILQNDNDGNTLYQCTKCLASYPTATAARRHFTAKHTDPDAKKQSQRVCVSVGGSPTKVSRKDKQKTVSQKPPICNYCNTNFNNEYVLTKHILEEHSIENVKDTDLEADKKIYNHVYTVVKDENYCDKCRCKLCGKLFKKPTIAITHFKKLHLKLYETDEQFICSHCGKECYDEMSLKRHEDSHTLVFTCATCKKVYKSRACFKQHICFKDTYRSEMKRDMICDHCGKNFVSKHSLKIHIRYFHGPLSQRFKCQHCPKTFGAYSLWKGHQVKHTRERNFSCDICGNVFVTKMALVYHTRIHTGERPYECKYCDMSFLSSSRRAHHIKSHHIAAMATCDVCGITVKATGLTKHKRRHNNANSTLYINKDGGRGRKWQGAKTSAKKTTEQTSYYYDTDSE